MAQGKSTQDIRLFWNIFADIYEKTFNKTTIQINNILIPFLSILPGQTIAECGCGTGSGIILLFHQHPTIEKVLANDISEVILEKAQKRYVQNTEFFLASNESLPYESNTCDRYISNLSIHIVENPRNMLNEAFRILKPGGRGIISSPGLIDELDFLCNIRKFLSQAGADIQDNNNREFFANRENLYQMAKNIGFVNVRTFHSSVPFLGNSVKELVDMACEIPECLQIKKENPEIFKVFIEICCNEFSRIWNEGKTLNFNFLVLVFDKA